MNTHACFPLLPWHTQAWQHWHARMQLFAKGQQSMPHALLVIAPPDCGQFEFAQTLAASLLCETPQANSLPCGTCAACVWQAQGNHPDFRLVTSEAHALKWGAKLASQLGEDENDALAAENTSERKSKTPSREIKVEQVRALETFMTLSAHRSGRRVVLLHSANALNTIAANTLLKTLEEPTPQALFILVAEGLSGILPTILSRCQQMPLGLPDFDVALQWLTLNQKNQQSAKDVANHLRQVGGAPMAALALTDEGTPQPQDFVRLLVERNTAYALNLADKYQRHAIAEILILLQRLLFDVIALAAHSKARYYPEFQSELMRVAKNGVASTQIAQFRQISQQRRIAHHPLNARLLLESIFMQLV